MNEVFINEAINNGIVNYIKNASNEEINKTHYFEYCVIKTLTMIYNEINIINPYRLKSEEAFYKNLSLFGLKKDEADLFIKYMNEYGIWLNNPTSDKRTKLINNIQSIIINMILLKSNLQEITEEEMFNYDNFLNPKEGDLKKIINLLSIDYNLIPTIWERKKHQIHPDLKLEIIKPELLDTEVYEKFNISKEELEKMTNMEIKKLNEKILENESEEETGGRGKFDPRKLVLTSGNGFVDTIVLLSIIVTEIMIGLIITLAIMRR